MKIAPEYPFSESHFKSNLDGNMSHTLEVAGIFHDTLISYFKVLVGAFYYHAAKRYPRYKLVILLLGDLYGLEKFWAFLKFYKVSSTLALLTKFYKVSVVFLLDGSHFANHHGIGRVVDASFLLHTLESHEDRIMGIVGGLEMS